MTINIVATCGGSNVLNKAERMNIEYSISGKITHRLAKHIVMILKDLDTTSDNQKVFNYVHTNESVKFMANLVDVLVELGLPSEIANRIIINVPERARDEVKIFETRGEFTEHGADQCTLETALLSDIMRLEAVS